MPSHPLTNFEAQRQYENEPRFNGVYSRSNLPKKIKDGAYINLDDCNESEIVYFNSFGVEHVPGEIKEFLGNKNLIANIFKYKQTIQ